MPKKKINNKIKEDIQDATCDDAHYFHKQCMRDFLYKYTMALAHIIEKLPDECDDYLTAFISNWVDDHFKKNN